MTSEREPKLYILQEVAAASERWANGQASDKEFEELLVALVHQFDEFDTPPPPPPHNPRQTWNEYQEWLRRELPHCFPENPPKLKDFK